MLKVETDLIKLEYDDKLNEVSGEIINNILDKIYSSSGISVKSFDSNNKTDIKLLNNKEHYDGIKPEEPIEIDVRKLSLPRCVTDLTCIDCHQSFLMQVKQTGDILFKNYNDNKMYCLGDIKIPKLPASNKSKTKKLIAIYNDCLNLCSSEKTYKLISDSDDILVCPFCGKEISIKDMISYTEMEHTNDKCFICGSETELVMNKEASMSKKCLENNCLESIT